MRGLSLFEGSLVLLQIAVVDEETDELSDGHRHSLHVGVVEIALVTALGDSLAAHEFVC